MDEEIAQSIDVAADGWVADCADPVCWENGMKWLSKAIVSDNDPFDKKELKIQLERHISIALCSPKKEIRQTGFFYVLAWKRLDLIAGYGQGDGQALLRSALERLYEKHDFHYFSLKLLVRNDWAGSLASVAALLQKKIGEHEKKAYAAGLQSGDEILVARTLRTIDECVHVLGIPVVEFETLLVDFWRKRQVVTGDLIAIGDIRRSRQYFAMVEPVRELLQAVGADHSRILSSYLDLAKGEDFFAGLRWCLRWGCRDGMAKALDKIWPEHLGLVARLVRVHIESPALDQKRCEALVNLAGRNREGVRELLELCMDPSASAPNLASAIEEGLCVSERRIDVFVLTGAMVEGMRVKSPEIISVRARFLSKIWDMVEGSEDVDIWDGALQILYELVDASRDTLIDGEFFLPLLREALFSESLTISRMANGYLKKRPDLKKVVLSWLSEPQLQTELASGLSSLRLQDQVKTLNRLVTLYCRYPVPSAYLSKRVARYVEHLEKTRIEGGLKEKMRHAAERIGLCVAVNGQQGRDRG